MYGTASTSRSATNVGPRSLPAITGIQNEAMISATDPQRSNGGVRQETRSNPPRSSSTFEPHAR